MRVGLAVWGERISPVLDSARRLLLVDLDQGEEVGRQEVSLAEAGPGPRARRLADLGVHALVCGAVSRPLACILAASGIEVIPFVAGDVEEVLSAYRAGRLPGPGFSLPGGGPRGRGRRRRARGGRGPGGVCACPNCGATLAHGPGRPCASVACPRCGARMMRGWPGVGPG